MTRAGGSDPAPVGLVIGPVPPPEELPSPAVAPPFAVEVNGLVLAGEQRGEGDPPLLLIHGYTGSSIDWVDVFDDLSRARRVVVYDQRGHGASTNTGDPSSYRFEYLQADLEKLVDALGFGTFDLLGHSMGGVVALRCLLAHPERVRSAVLMDTAAEPAGELPIEIFAGLADLGRAQGMEAVAGVVADFVGGSSSPVLERSRAEKGDVPAQRLRTKFAALDPEALEALAHELNQYPSMVADLGRISCPTTVVVGEHDLGLRSAAEVMAERIPGAVLAVIPDAEHSPQIENRDAWLAAVRAHLERAAG